MQNIKAYIQAARLRTLPLSISGIIVGCSLAVQQTGLYSILISPVFWLAVLTTLGFQVLSNFSNDYGDGIKGTDKNRVGEKRLVASGVITPKAMKRAIILTTIVTAIAIVALVYVALGSAIIEQQIFFLALGLLAIVSAITYTVGKNAYGYVGLGDLFVFIFFGLISVLGSYFLMAKQTPLLIILPALTIGFLSTAVLNLNNLRDYKTDIQAGKRTLVVKLGINNGKKYHYFLILGSIIASISFTLITHTCIWQFLYILAFIPLVKHLFKVRTTKNTVLLDGELKKVALSTFAFAVLFSMFL